MKHIIHHTSFWKFSADPFPRFLCELSHGRNKRDSEFLPTKVSPAEMFRVTAPSKSGIATIFEGGKEEAEERKNRYDLSPREEDWYVADIRSVGFVLPENQFQIIKTKEKGTLLVVPGEESTDRCLFFSGEKGGFRGDVGVETSGTTGTLLKVCQAGNACESDIQTITILEKGQSVAYHTYGRRTNDVVVHTWNGSEIVTSSYTKEEWVEKETSETSEIGEIL